MGAQPLSGIRVLDFTWVRAGPWGTRWLATLGAEVIKVEWPDPSALRNSMRVGEGTTPPGVPLGPNSSGMFNDTNAGKLGITLNLRTPRGLDLAKQLLAISDVVIENFSSRVMKDWGLGYEEMVKIKPDIIYVSMAGLGHVGRNSHYETNGSTVQALSGLTFLSGLPGAPPAGWGWSYMDDSGGMYGAMSVLTALHHRNQTGQGQHVDLSQVAAGMTLTGPALLDVTVNGRSCQREGYPPGNRTMWPGAPLVNNYRGPTTAPHNAYRTAGEDYNGWCVIACFSDREWRALVEVIGSPAWANDDRFATLAGRVEHQEALDQHVAAWASTLEKYELAARCQAAGVRAMPVQSNQDRVEHDPQLRAQEMYRPVHHAVLGTNLMQNFPFTLSETPTPVERPAPLIGEHNAEVLGGLLGLRTQEITTGYEDGTFWPANVPLEPYLLPVPEISASATPREREPAATVSSTTARRFASGPLGDLRVLELADERGQWCGKLLADLGADVIKIEPPAGVAERRVGPFYEDNPHPERSLSFWHYNTSKRGITLNLETADGRALFRRLVSTADVLLETYTLGYLPSLGLGYEQLQALNPRLIMCSLTDFGQTGPWRDYRGSDLLHLAAGGQMASCGYNAEDVPNAPPIAPGGGNAWHMGCHYAYIAIMAAVCMRDVTGKGQYIDASIHGACALTTEGAVSTWIYTKQVVKRNTGRHASAGPSAPSQFRCKDGKYVNSPGSRGMPQTPKRLKVYAAWMDSYGLAQDLLDPKYEDPAVFRASEAHIAEVAENFFAHIPAEDVYHGAQERGFPTGAVRTPADTLQDPHWHDRGFFVEVDHPELGKRFTYPGGAAIYSSSPWQISRRAPLIGEHNGEVYHEVGLSGLELAVLTAAGVI